MGLRGWIYWTFMGWRRRTPADFGANSDLYSLILFDPGCPRWQVTKGLGHSGRQMSTEHLGRGSSHSPLPWTHT